MTGSSVAVAAARGLVQRTELLHGMNTEAFGNSGAIRVGDYKMVVEAKVSESEIYTYAQHILQDADFDSNELEVVLTQKLLKDPGTFYIFNIAKNPSELETGNCDDLEACSNLYGDIGFKSVQDTLMDAWRRYRDSMVESNEVWQDDGPLTNPALFGGFWSPWRDENNLPYALYDTIIESDHFDTEGHATAPMHSQSDGLPSVTGGRTWKKQKSLSSDPSDSSGPRSSSPSLASAEHGGSSTRLHPPSFLVGTVLGAGTVLVLGMLTRAFVPASPERYA